MLFDGFRLQLATTVAMESFAAVCSGSILRRICCHVPYDTITPGDEIARPQERISEPTFSEACLKGFGHTRNENDGFGKKCCRYVFPETRRSAFPFSERCLEISSEESPHAVGCYT